MAVRLFVIGIICICMSASSAWSAPKTVGGSNATATPQAKKLSPKGGAACFKACMHGVSSVGWGNFCDAACFGS